MNYLFFDIECAGVFKDKAKICAFGYCRTDEQFHILEKEDLLIDPQGNFHLTDRKGEQGIVLPYQYAEFKNYPTFSKRAEKIYSLLQDKNTLVVGHAVQNDVKYLNLESKRFSLPSFRFSFADTQFIYMNVIGDFSRQFGLGAIAESLGIDFTAHKAVDDAYATMRVAQALCQREGVGFTELIEKYAVTLGKIENYEITQTTSAGFAAYKLNREKEKEARDRARAAFHVFADREKRKRAKDGKLKNQSVCFSHAVELQTATAKKLLVKAFALGARITFRAEECDLYVCLDDETGQRKKSVAERGARIFSPEDFEKYTESLQ